MEEQKELDDLKRLMTEQQSKLANTMAEMELKASTLQEKLDKKSELSESNAKAGVKKVALEYKVVDLDMSVRPPPGFMFGKPNPAGQFGRGFSEPAKFPDPTSKEFEDQAVMKDMKQETRKRLLEFEKTTLKELGEDGWTLRSINEVYIGEDMTTYMYYFSRPL